MIGLIQFIADDRWTSEIEIATWAMLTYWHLVPGFGN